MAAVQAEDVCGSFLLVGDLNGHHQKWLSSRTTDRHGVVAIDFATVKVKVFYGQGPPSGESTTTECMVNYQLLAAVY